MTSPDPTLPAPIASPIVMMGQGREGFFCTAIVAMRCGEPGFRAFVPDALGLTSCLPVSARRSGPTARRAAIPAACCLARRAVPPRGTRH